MYLHSLAVFEATTIINISPMFVKTFSRLPPGSVIEAFLQESVGKTDRMQ